WFGLGYKLVTGQDHTKFHYARGENFMSSLPDAIAVICCYLVIIFGGQELMRNRAPINPGFLFKVHNVFLTFASLALLVLFIEQILPMILEHGMHFALCSPDATNQQLQLLYYLNYLLKYYELLDTGFMVLKKKNLDFLHWFHHAMTAILCWVCLDGKSNMCWVVITLNLTVHVLMYWFYFETSRGKKPWWKQWVTRSQITQFMIDLCVIGYTFYSEFTKRFIPSLPHHPMGCSGTKEAASFGGALIFAYLVLFMQFYTRTYENKK
ncbi:GNS1/SUR4 membrane protein, partial [Ramicandelaber brevisporus]